MEDRKSCCASYFHHSEAVMYLTPLWERHSVPFEMVAAYCSGYFLLNIFNDLQCKFCLTSKLHRADLLYASCEPLCSRYTVAYCCRHIFANLHFSDRMVLKSPLSKPPLYLISHLKRVWSRRLLFVCFKYTPLRWEVKRMMMMQSYVRCTWWIVVALRHVNPWTYFIQNITPETNVVKYYNEWLDDSFMDTFILKQQKNLHTPKIYYLSLS